MVEGAPTGAREEVDLLLTSFPPPQPRMLAVNNVQTIQSDLVPNALDSLGAQLFKGRECDLHSKLIPIFEARSR
jgi:hypothetical protein